ncbi:hypothetical protein PBRA_004032 [Plasmodiophora brassicae]|uniref:malate synthase n=1 Tax=Plasmodiophora brassicae TaxID=37360 RepID=A0A0G4IJ47_PLABS|nr:hypothetical protein PBRA_004032 [Plasmodiophora brassicae]
MESRSGRVLIRPASVALLPNAHVEQVLSRGTLDFVEEVAVKFQPQLLALLVERERIEQRLNTSQDVPRFRPDTAHIRADGSWKASSASTYAQRLRRACTVHVVVPVDDLSLFRSAWASSADGLQVDFDDAHAPSWLSSITAQAELARCCQEADPTSPLLIMRPRSLHMFEEHVTMDGAPVSGALWDALLFLFANGHRLQSSDCNGPFFYIPKLENQEEARWWNDVFEYVEMRLGLVPLSIQCIVLIENVLAAFECEEILFALRHRCVGLNSGKFDYIFSIIRKFHRRPEFLLPPRSQLHSNHEFFRTHLDILVAACVRRGAIPTTGMWPHLVTSNDNLQMAYGAKLGEARAGSLGALVAHVGFIEPVRKAFRDGSKSTSQRHLELMETWQLPTAPFLAGIEKSLLTMPRGFTVRPDDLEHNISVVVGLANAWSQGRGVARCRDLLEDLATAEICRSLLWQWIRYRAVMESGQTITRQVVAEHAHRIANGSTGLSIVHAIIQSDTFIPFLSDLLAPLLPGSISRITRASNL